MSPPRALRVAVCDDEAPARSRLRELLADCAASMPVDLVGEAASGVQLIALLQECEADVVLLDVRMPGMDGLETAGHLGKLARPPRVIFATAFDAHAVKAFELQAVDYLLKPIRGERLLEALLRVRSLEPAPQEGLREISPAPRTHLSVPERGRVLLVPVADILYLRAELKYVVVRTASAEHLVEDSLVRLEQEFEASFIRIHRSHLVAKRHLAGFERNGKDGDGGWVAVVKGLAERLPVSRRQAPLARAFGRIRP